MTVGAEEIRQRGHHAEQSHDGRRDPCVSLYLASPRALEERGAPSSATVDRRVLKYFDLKPHGKLDLVVEAFNLLNRPNVSQINPVYGPLFTARPAFGRPIEAGIAR